MKYAEIVVDVPLFSKDQYFDYAVPTALCNEVAIGSRVLVPFGSRKVEGYIITLKNSTNVDRIREILLVLDDVPPLSSEQIAVGKFISERYLCSLFVALQMMVPTALRTKYVKWIEWNNERDDFPLIVLPEEEEVLTYIRAKRAIELKALLKKFPNTEPTIEHFIKTGLLREVTKAKDHSDAKTEKYVRLHVPSEEVEKCLHTLPANATKQKAIIQLLLQEQFLPLSQVLTRTQSSYSSVNRLCELQIVSIEEVIKRRDPYALQTYERDYARTLTQEQQSVYEQIIQPIVTNQFQSFLLHGVTGSGKTEVYLQVIDFALHRGKSAIVLVPEISLTPMMVGRFKRRFGEQVAVLHSALSAGEKLDEWRRIQRGEAKVVIGARSAIFAPVSHLGIVIIDEEHETTYKQEEQPRYHTREVAMLRASLTNSIVLLGSATPSLESYAYAKAGRYILLEMKQRVNEQSMPKIHLVDMRNELNEGHRHMFSRLLMSKIEDRLQKREQVVLLLNRRGYSTFVLCRSCGYTAECPHCDISLTYHQTNHTIRCHYCDYIETMPATCPKCQSDSIRYFGIGTQRIEEELSKLFPGIRVIRMDMDTTSRKGAHEHLLQAFGNYEADVLLGTQMIAKGLDFPKVSLVGMISADTMLHLPDFRSSERTFQLITQVAGRAGRHDIPGEVIVQTYTPDHYSIQLSVEHHYSAFFNHEIQLRKMSKYPPFYRIALIHFAHEHKTIVAKAIGRFVDELHTYVSGDIDILGPVPASIKRIKDRYRYHCMIKYKNEPKLNGIIARSLTNIDDMIQKNKVHINIDIDPQYLM